MRSLLHSLTVALIILLLSPNASAAAGAGGSGGDVDQFVSVPNLSSTIMSSEHLAIIQLEVVLDIPDNQLRNRANFLMPRIRDAFNRVLKAYVDTNYRPHTVPDADRIRNNLQLAVNSVVGDGATVYLGMVIVHEG